MLTSNDAEKVPLPLLNRCTVVDLLPVGFQNLCGFARAETARAVGCIGRGHRHGVGSSGGADEVHQPAERDRQIEKAEVLERRPRLQ